MTPSDQEIVSALLRTCEGLYVQTLLLRVILQKAGVADWRSTLDTLIKSEAASLGRATFQGIYAQAVRDRQMLDSFLEKLPTSGPVQ